MNAESRTFLLLVCLSATLLALPFAFAALSCSIEAGNSTCGTGTKILGLQNDTGGYDNAHAQNATVGTYNNSLCCTDTGYTLSSACGSPFVKLSGDDNAHAQQANYSDYGVNACISSSGANYTCTYSDTGCASPYSCVLSLANADGLGDNGTNAHIGACGTYTRSVCCTRLSVCVNETGVCWATIQQAIDNATSGQTVVITDASTYNENVSIGKRLTITSNASSGYPTVASSTNTMLVTTSNNLTLSKLNISVTGGSGVAAISMAAGNLDASDISLWANGSANVNYLFYDNTPNGNVTFNRVNGTCAQCLYGIYQVTGTRFILNNSKLTGLADILAYFPDTPAIVQNTSINGTGSWAIISDDFSSSGSLQITNATIISATFEAVKTGSGNSTITDSVLQTAGSTGYDSVGAFVVTNTTVTSVTQCINANIALNRTSYIINSTCSSGGGLAIAGSASVNETFYVINSSTFTPSGTSFTTCSGGTRRCDVYFQNFLDAYVNDSAGSPISSATVNYTGSAQTNVSYVPTNQTHNTTKGTLNEGTFTVNTTATITSGCYTNLTTSNNQRCTVDGTASTDGYFLTNFSLPSGVTWNFLYVTVEWNSSIAGDSCGIALYNWSSAGYVRFLNITCGTADATQTYNLSTGLTNFVNSSTNIARVLFYHNSTSLTGNLGIDYVNLWAFGTTPNATISWSLTTNSSGQISQQNVSWGLKNSSLTEYYDNYTLSANKTRYATNSTSLAFQNTNQNVTFTLYPGVPTHTTPILNASDYPTNSSSASLTCYNQSTVDADGDAVTNVYTWTVNSSSLSLVVMPFDTNVSSTAARAIRDYAGGDDNGTLGDAGAGTQPAWNASGKRGGAYSYNGSQFIELPGRNLTGSFTVTAWINQTATTGTRVIIKKLGSFGVQVGNTGRIDGFINSTDLFSTINYSSAGYINQWQHIAFTYNASSGQTAFYNNGTLDSNGTYSGSIPANTNLIRVGDGFVGTIDDVRVFNRSLSAAQVYQLFLEGNNSVNTSTILPNETAIGDVWQCSVTPNDNSGDGTTLSSNTLTIVNAAPTHTTPILNASDYPQNRTNASLTCYNQSTADADADTVHNEYTWTVDGQDLLLLSMPFDVNITSGTANAVRDYAGGDNNGTLGSNSTNRPQWGAGKVGGAYNFSNSNQSFINVTGQDFLDNVTEGTIMAWVYYKGGAGFSQVFVADSGNCVTPFEFAIARSGNNGRVEIWADDSGCSAVFDAYATVTNMYTSNAWYHIAYKSNASGNWFFVNGIRQNVTYVAGSASQQMFFANTSANATKYKIGSTISSTSEYYNGSIDDVRIYNRSLSDEQIYQIFLEGNNSINTSTIVANETDLGDVWACTVHPNDQYGDGSDLTSNTLTIRGTIPNVPTLVLPLDNNVTVVERYPTFNWTGIDPDGDPVTFYWNISSPAGCAAIPEQSTSQLYYISTDKLCVDQSYNWTVYACDGIDGCSAQASPYNFTIASVVGLTFVNTAIDFGDLDPSTPSNGTVANTSTDSPPPLTYNNTGNVDINVSAKANAVLWTQQGLDTQYFQYADENGTAWQNWSASYALLNTNRSYQSVPRELEIQVEVPLNEPSGYKNTSILVLGASIE